MKIEEAKCFVEKFCNTEYTQSEHESFVLWLKEASIDDLNSVADCIERYPLDKCEFLSPSKEWTFALEKRIDKLELRKLSKGPSYRYAWARSRKFALAVSIPIVLSIVSLLRKEIPGSRWVPSYTVISTEIGEHKFVKLWDGTAVWLNSGSRLKYVNKTPEKTRNVEIMGEAFFDVPPESLHPFVVISGDIKVQVLGTSFDVRNYPLDDALSINVIDGKVMVTRGESQAVVNAKQQMKWAKNDSKAQNFVVSTFDDVAPFTVWRSGMLQFANEKIGTVLKELSVSFGFEYAAGDISSESRLTGTFTMDESIDEICERLQFVFKDIKFQYDKRSKRVLVLKIR